MAWLRFWSLAAQVSAQRQRVGIHIAMRVWRNTVFSLMLNSVVEQGLLVSEERNDSATAVFGVPSGSARHQLSAGVTVDACRRPQRHAC